MEDLVRGLIKVFVAFVKAPAEEAAQLIVMCLFFYIGFKLLWKGIMK